MSEREGRPPPPPGTTYVDWQDVAERWERAYRDACRERDEALEQLAKARAKVARTKDAMKLVGVVRKADERKKSKP